MPAEWEKHSATWLAWPHNKESWPGKLAEIEKTWLGMIAAISKGETVNLLVNDEAEQKYVQEKLSADAINKNVAFHFVHTVDAWLRDSGPTFVVNKKQKQLAMVKWDFNAWGNKYADLALDRVLPDRINEILHLQAFDPQMILEGGSIDVNGKGILLATEQCLLNKNRNPNLSKAEIEQKLRDFLGINQITWLKEGIAGDDTDGHIDDIARFVTENTVLCAVENDKKDENYGPLQENYQLLKKVKLPNGKGLKVIQMPLPDKVADSQGRLPASYMNFYIANSSVLVPVFGHKNDKKALAAIAKFFPKRKIVAICSEHLVLGFGAIHCVTQQQPFC